ncbi:MAG TPA: diheme cytochrome c-553 [Candidatus Krumholzibacteria bacterium]|nr:diheme cytochrome c-553 [Candidatus Krumholzibacteria bacterium]
MKVAIRTAALAVALGFAVAACGNDAAEQNQDAEQDQVADQTQVAGQTEAAGQNQIERGKYLVDVIGCHDCHSPKNFTPEGIPVPDMSKALSGYWASAAPPAFDKRALTPGNWYGMAPDLTAYAGPWGISYAANITPDEQTGIGLWTEDIFVAAIRTGKHMGAGRPILPPMPWHYYKNATDEDLKAIFAYLKSLPPIKNAVPAPVGPQDAAKM